MKILTNSLVLPRWMKPSPAEPLAPTAAGAELFAPQGMPCSVLPRAVQDKLRAGQTISEAEAQPVPVGPASAPSPHCRP